MRPTPRCTCDSPYHGLFHHPMPKRPTWREYERRRALERLAENTQTTPSNTTGGTK